MLYIEEWLEEEVIVLGRISQKFPEEKEFEIFFLFFLHQGKIKEKNKIRKIILK
jgi:hypothetical protein